MSATGSLQGGGTGLDTQNPTVLPQTYDGYTANGVTQLTSPDTLSAQRVAGSCALTLGGTFTTGNIFNLKFTYGSFPNGSLTVSATVAGGDTASTFGEKLAAAINNSATCRAYEIFATSAVGVVTIKMLGVASQVLVCSYTQGGNTVTGSFANSGKLLGGSGPIVPLNNFNASFNGVLTRFRYGIPRLLSFPQVQSLLASGQPLK